MAPGPENIPSTEQTCATLLTQVPVGIFGLDTQGHYTYINPYGYEIMGLSVDTALGMSWQSSIHPDDRTLMLAALEQAKTGNGPVPIEYRLQQPRGTMRWVLGQMVADRDATGEVRGLVGSLMDISDRKQTEMALAENESQHRAVFAAIPDLMFRVGQDGVYRGFVSHRRDLDIIPENLSPVGRSMADMLPPDLAERQFHYLQQALQTGTMQIYEQTVFVGDCPHDEEVRVIQSSDDEVLFIVRDITTRKRAEAALRRSEQTNRTIINTIPDLLIQMDREGYYTQMLGGSEVHVRHPQPDRTRPDVYSVLPPDLAKQRLYYAQQALDSGRLQIYEQLFDTGNEYRCEEVRIAPLDDQNVLIIIRDITDRKQAEAERLQAEKLRLELTLLEQIFDLVLGGYWDWDMVNHREYLSPGFKRMLGYREEQLPNLPESWQNLIFPEDLPLLWECFHRHVESHGTHPFYNEVRYRHKNGSTVWVICSGQVIEWDAAGQPLRMIGCHINISDRKQAELERQQLIQELSAFKFALDQAAIVAITDAKGVITYVNDRFCDISGYTAAEVIGQTHHLVNSGYHSAEFFRDLWTTVSGGNIWQGEVCNRARDGSLYWVASTMVPFLDSQGQPFQYLAIRFDITDRKQAEIELQATNEHLARATRLKDEFLANMSHELRTPLNAILGMAEGLLESVFGTLNSKQVKALQTIEQSGFHLLELINDVLDLAKIEAGQMELDYGPTAIASLCQASLDFIRAQAQKKQIQLGLNLPASLPDLWLDERRIRQVLINLLTNAVKFTPTQGQVTLDVSLPTLPDTPSPSLLRIRVQDTGIGIDPDHLSKLFQPFIQIDSALNRKYEGTGLGLALVKRITELHEGQVNVTSEPGFGSCFTVDLPYRQCPLDPAENFPIVMAPPPSSPANPSLLSAKPTIAPLLLLAEESKAHISTMTSYLQAKGYHLLLTESAPEAIAHIHTTPCQMLVIDLATPGLDGPEFIRQIRHTPSLTHIPILALTPPEHPGDSDRCLAAGAHTCITQPVPLKQLMITIQKLLTSHPLAELP